MHKALARTRTSSAAVLLAVVLAVDVLVALTDLPRAALGVADEVAHLSTAVLLLRVAAARWPLARPLPPTLIVAALAASVLIDVDHVPADVFGSDVLTEGTKRAVHALPVHRRRAGPCRGRRQTRYGATGPGRAVGVALHLCRDLATGGVALVWPASTALVTVPYLVYALTLVAGVLIRPPETRSRLGPRGARGLD